MAKWFFILMFMLPGIMNTSAQEMTAPLKFNGARQHDTKPKQTKALKSTALTLPFFEDFTINSTFPDQTNWKDIEVYINNTMCISPVSRGVATFDGLNAAGIPYNTTISTALVYADSLTSAEFALKSFTPADSIYLSFFYQPQGNGFYPETQDSLMLYFKKSNGAWVKVWSKEGTLLDSFKQVMVPVKDTAYLHDTFQFRFVNKASLNTNDDVWNVDYIRMASNRNMNDTLISDVAFTTNPSYLLGDLTYMPYRQFIVDPNKELASNMTVSVRNNNVGTQSVNCGYSATEIFTSTPLSTGAPIGASILPNSTNQYAFSAYTNKMASTNLYDNFTFRNTYYIQSVSPTDNKVNDTIYRDQIFHNYMAYDDGTAEKAYYLNLFPTLPGKTAIEFHLNRPDTIMGVSIYFGRQVPLAYLKYFSVAVYKSISTSGSGSDVKVYQEDLLIPAYQRNDFEWTYKFTTPVAMDAGTFYIGTIQPALSNSDSLYIGLDVNRTGANHLYYNVVGYWQPSTVSGALMIRPILGQIIATGVNDRLQKSIKVFVSPNPSKDKVQVVFDDIFKGDATYNLYNVEGRLVNTGQIQNKDWLDISNLASGLYYLKISNGESLFEPQKIIKY